MKITNVTYHRNGVTGRGFWAANVTHEGERLTITRPSSPCDLSTTGDDWPGDGVECFVTSRDNDATHCFLGDYFAQAMDAAIEAYKLANWATVA